MDQYHFFSDPEYAGPGPVDLLKFWDSGGYTLRSLPRRSNPEFKFPDSGKIVKSELASPKDAEEIAAFWNNYYRGEDWYFICSWVDVSRWIKSGFIVLLKHESAIIGTFVCHLLPGVYSGKLNRQAALLDGLVVAPMFRGKGVASFLLASMDYEVYRRPELNQSILMWFREHQSRLTAVSQTPISILEYSYAKISDLEKREKHAVLADPQKVTDIVKTIYEKSRTDFTLLLNYATDPDVYWFLAENALIGIAFTHRVGVGDYTLWEVVFAANLQEPHFEKLQIPIEMAAARLPCSKGLIFASNGKSRGNAPFSSPWLNGRSGYLTMHVYNWMPPTFLKGDIFFPMSCI